MSSKDGKHTHATFTYIHPSIEVTALSARELSGTATPRLAVEFCLQSRGPPPHGSLWNFPCSPGHCHHRPSRGISPQSRGLPPHGSLWNFPCRSGVCHHTARCGISNGSPGTATTGRPVAFPHSPGDCHHTTTHSHIQEGLLWHYPQSRRLPPQTPAHSPLAGLAAL